MGPPFFYHWLVCRSGSTDNLLPVSRLHFFCNWQEVLHNLSDRIGVERFFLETVHARFKAFILGLGRVGS